MQAPRDEEEIVWIERALGEILVAADSANRVRVDGAAPVLMPPSYPRRDRQERAILRNPIEGIFLMMIAEFGHRLFELGGLDLMSDIDEKVTVGRYDHMALLDTAWSAARRRANPE